MARQKTSGSGFIVLSHFRDIANWDQQYYPGDDVSDFAEDRLKSLVARGLVSEPAKKGADDAAKSAQAEAEKKAAEEAVKVAQAEADQKAKDEAKAAQAESGKEA